MILHIDIETYSSVDIKKSGVYRYCQSPDFEITLFAYAFNDEPVRVIDLASGGRLPENVLNALTDKSITKWAHNANFERVCLRAIGIDTPIEQWRCTAVLSAYAGLPRSLSDVSAALRLGEKGKMAEGKSLIRYFCIPSKPTKLNGGRYRNLPSHDMEKWQLFKQYCAQDVEAEREIHHSLKGVDMPTSEWAVYHMDQEINDRGVRVDMQLTRGAIKIDEHNTALLMDKMRNLTNLDNPNSDAQIKWWIRQQTAIDVKSLNKDNYDDLLVQFEKHPKVIEVLNLRAMTSKSSIKKYTAIEDCVCADGRVRGLFAHYGASRTGRWSGRLVQLQNLRRNDMTDLDTARELVRCSDYAALSMMYDDVSDVLSQLIRTAFVADEGKVLAPCDFSAIEARVIAWLAGERWRLEVFQTHGKIYEASAAMMFNVHISEVTKGSEMRQKGKIAELALGYQGGVGALVAMGGEAMGLSADEMAAIVSLWRSRNPAIVRMWAELNNAAIACLTTMQPVRCCGNRIIFRCQHDSMTVRLPSGRKLYYREPRLVDGTFGKAATYMGQNQTTGKWGRVDTYGGKLAENIVQAIARDLLAEAMWRVRCEGHEIIMHVHDEIVVEGLEEHTRIADIERLMGEVPQWANGLPLTAEGFITKYYQK